MSSNYTTLRDLVQSFKKGTFRLEYEYGPIEYECDFRISIQLCSQSPHSSLLLTIWIEDIGTRLEWNAIIQCISTRFEKSYSLNLALVLRSEGPSFKSLHYTYDPKLAIIMWRERTRFPPCHTLTITPTSLDLWKSFDSQFLLVEPRYNLEKCVRCKQNWMGKGSIYVL